MQWWRMWRTISRSFPEDFRDSCGDAMDQAAADTGASRRTVRVGDLPTRFVTLSAGDGRLFVAAGRRVLAFR